ncbi:hypothetical protein Hanom_Chr15g01372961 [Helianthus anomalus]
MQRTEDWRVETAERMDVSDESASLMEDNCARRSSWRLRTSDRSCFSRRRMTSWIFSARAAAVPEESASEKNCVELKSDERNLEKIGSDAKESKRDKEEDVPIDDDGVAVVKVVRSLKVDTRCMDVRWTAGDAIFLDEM